MKTPDNLLYSFCSITASLTTLHPSPNLISDCNSRFCVLSVSSVSPSLVTPESGEESSILESAVLEFSSVLRPVMGEGEDRELEPGERRPGNRLWPGENSGGSGLVTGGWNAEGKDLRMGASPGSENIGLGESEVTVIII